MPRKPPKLLKLPKTRRNNKLSLEALTERREKAYELRVIGRKSFRDIAAETGVSVATAKEDCDWITKMKVKGMIERDETMRVEANHIYNTVLSRWLPLVMDDGFVVQGIKEGKDGPKIIHLDKWDAASTATDKILKVLDQQSKLNGFYATKNDLKTPREFGQEMALGVMALGVMEAMKNLAGGTMKKAIVVDAQLIS